MDFALTNKVALQSVRNLIINNVNQYKTFGLRYDVDTQAWTEITALNLSSSNVFDLGNWRRLRARSGHD